jgi:hypothetical protein
VAIVIRLNQSNKARTNIDEAKIHIDGLDNFASHYEPISDTYFAIPNGGQATTYMVKSVLFEWWFIIQIVFHSTSNQKTVADENKKLWKKKETTAADI